MDRFAILAFISAIVLLELYALYHLFTTCMVNNCI